MKMIQFLDFKLVVGVTRDHLPPALHLLFLCTIIFIYSYCTILYYVYI